MGNNLGVFEVIIRLIEFYRVSERRICQVLQRNSVEFSRDAGCPYQYPATNK